jgi:DNA (cytosine-5)-methyltransferase 1
VKQAVVFVDDRARAQARGGRVKQQRALFRRPPQVRDTFALPGELVVDLFAGGGGASTGIAAALGRPVDIAIDHDPEAIAMHAVNHPKTKHFCENVWQVDPREVCRSRPVGLAWFSPDCVHFSRARSATPVKKEIRGLAWVVVRWAKTVRPRVIVLENVEEFQTWGPLKNGRPDLGHAGRTFRQWLGKLHGLGYSIEFRSLVAADYGAPTTRKRLYLIARRDGRALAWPEATHGAGRRRAWRPAAEIIDWSLPCPSIFERAKPLADATLRRIAEGLRRYVIETADPFIVPVTHQGAVRVHGIREPLRTITAAHRGEFALAVPTLIAQGWGERKGQAPRVPGLAKPLGTVVAGGVKQALVAAFLSKHYGGMVGHGVTRPSFAEVRAFLTKFYGTGVGARARDALPTVTGQGQHLGLLTVHGEEYAIADIGMRMLQPHELFAAQGFPDDYVIDVLKDGEPITKTAQIKLAGNSVCPPVAEAIVAAQVRQRGTEAA